MTSSHKTTDAIAIMAAMIFFIPFHHAKCVGCTKLSQASPLYTSFSTLYILCWYYYKNRGVGNKNAQDHPDSTFILTKSQMSSQSLLHSNSLYLYILLMFLDTMHVRRIGALLSSRYKQFEFGQKILTLISLQHEMKYLINSVN